MCASRQAHPLRKFQLAVKKENQLTPKELKQLFKNTKLEKKDHLKYLPDKPDIEYFENPFGKTEKEVKKTFQKLKKAERLNKQRFERLVVYYEKEINSIREEREEMVKILFPKEIRRKHLEKIMRRLLDKPKIAFPHKKSERFPDNSDCYFHLLSRYIITGKIDNRYIPLWNFDLFSLNVHRPLTDVEKRFFRKQFKKGKKEEPCFGWELVLKSPKRQALRKKFSELEEAINHKIKESLKPKNKNRFRKDQEVGLRAYSFKSKRICDYSGEFDQEWQTTFKDLSCEIWDEDWTPKKVQLLRKLKEKYGKELEEEFGLK